MSLSWWGYGPAAYYFESVKHKRTKMVTFSFWRSYDLFVCYMRIRSFWKVRTEQGVAARAISTTAHVSSSEKINLWNAFALFNTHLKWWLIILSNAPAKHSNFSFLKSRICCCFQSFMTINWTFFWSICQIQLEAHPLTVMGKFYYFMSLFYYYWSIHDNKKHIQQIDLSGKLLITLTRRILTGDIFRANCPRFIYVMMWFQFILIVVF